MKVRELIEYLQGEDPEAEVVMCEDVHSGDLTTLISAIRGFALMTEGPYPIAMDFREMVDREAGERRSWVKAVHL